MRSVGSTVRHVYRKLNTTWPRRRSVVRTEMQVTASKCKVMGRWRSWWLRRQYKITKLVVVGRSMTRLVGADTASRLDGVDLSVNRFPSATIYPTHADTGRLHAEDYGSKSSVSIPRLPFSFFWFSGKMIKILC